MLACGDLWAELRGVQGQGLQPLLPGSSRCSDAGDRDHREWGRGQCWTWTTGLPLGADRPFWGDLNLTSLLLSRETPLQTPDPLLCPTLSQKHPRPFHLVCQVLVQCDDLGQLTSPIPVSDFFTSKRGARVSTAVNARESLHIRRLAGGLAPSRCPAGHISPAP